MVRDNRHDSTYIFGAICPERGVGAAMIMPYANTEAMNAHLKEISAEVAPGAHAVLVCDGAGWHQGRRIDRPRQHHVVPAALLTGTQPDGKRLGLSAANKLCARVWNTTRKSFRCAPRLGTG